MLRLVHPAPSGQATRPPKGRHSAVLSLTAEEERHLRVAARNISRAYGGPDVLAKVIGVPTDTIYNLTASRGHRPSGMMAIRLTKAAGMHAEALLSGELSAAGRCNACGARVGHAADRRAS